jgi:hypothetical protein
MLRKVLGVCCLGTYPSDTLDLHLIDHFDGVVGILLDNMKEASVDYQARPCGPQKVK